MDCPPTGARPRPPAAAFVRIRACWYASAAMSDTNFCAARDNNRFLRCISADVANRRDKRDSQTNVFTFKADSLKVVICYFVRDLC